MRWLNLGKGISVDSLKSNLMADKGGAKKPYAYSSVFRSEEARGSRLEGQPLSDSLQYFKQTLVQLTEGCHPVESSRGAYCEKHGRPMELGRTRCDYLVEKMTRGGIEDTPKAQIQEYVKDVLGVRDPGSIKRLTGYQ
jgi:hypothetical protein